MRPRRASSLVLAIRMKCRAIPAPVMNHLRPWMTQSSPVRVAVVRIIEGSDPPPGAGSVITKDDRTVAISHYEGTIYGLSDVRISTGEPFDFSDELARIRQHFDIPDDDRACVVQDHGTRCGFGDGVRKGARFLASLTTQMISIQYGRPISSD